MKSKILRLIADPEALIATIGLLIGLALTVAAIKWDVR